MLLWRQLKLVVPVVLCARAAYAQPLTANDFLCFIDRYSAGSAAANCDGVGGLTPNDFLCFVNAYAAGASSADCDGSGSGGWTAFPQVPGSRTLYVASGGAGTGCTLGSPCALGTGLSLLRDGWTDHLLLRCGDTFTGPIQVTKGATTGYQVIGSYGVGPRPVIVCPSGNGISGEDLGKRGIAIVGLEIVGNRVNNTVGIRMLSWDDVLIEDCLVRDFRDNIVVQDADSTGVHRVKGLKVRRSVIVDSGFNNAPLTGFSQGIYVGGCDGWLIEENLFDRNGVPGSIFAHNVYIHETSGPGTFIGNITARSASEGIQQRPGGVLKNNLGIQNSYDFYFGGPGEVSYNVALDSADIGPGNERGRGFLIDGNTNTLHNFAGYNENGTGWGNCKAFGFRGVTGMATGNVVWDWRDNGGHGEGTCYEFDAASQVTMTGNRGYQPAGNFIVVGNASGSGNLWAGNAPSPGAGWALAPVPDPMCRIVDITKLSVPEFLAECRLQSRQNWRVEFTADWINDRVGERAGVLRP